MDISKEEDNRSTARFIEYPETLLLDRLFDTEVRSALWHEQQREGLINNGKCTENINPPDHPGSEAEEAALQKVRLSLPKIPIHGTIKLHGTHADVVFTRHHAVLDADVPSLPEDLAWVQSRNRVITPNSDNLGTAAFLGPRLSVLRAAAYTAFPTATEIVLAGEFAGSDIQKSVALSRLPRFFAVFAVKLDGEWAPRGELQKLTLPDPKRNHLYNILDFPTYEETLDFADLDATKARLLALTLAVEDECPFALQAGKVRNGIGEGIVWSGSYSINGVRRDLLFKTKGNKHRRRTRIPVKIQATRRDRTLDPEKVEHARLFIEEVLTGDRLEQGFEWLREMSLERKRQSVGSYIKWVVEDVKKEEEWKLAGRGLVWEDVVRDVTGAAREFYFGSLETG